MCLNIETPKTINFPFDTNGKLMILGVPILKPFRVMNEFTFNGSNSDTSSFCPHSHCVSWREFFLVTVDAFWKSFVVKGKRTGFHKSCSP